jgi:hypothetical protein
VHAEPPLTIEVAVHALFDHVAISPWPVVVTVRHYFARWNCDTAR